MEMDLKLILLPLPHALQKEIKYTQTLVVCVFQTSLHSKSISGLLNANNRFAHTLTNCPIFEPTPPFPY